ncbi:MAG: transposase, partial [Thiopseudomonas sp.]
MSWNDLRNGRVSLADGEYFVTFATHGRERVFADFDLACTFCRQIALNEQQCGCCWLAWVLMPDHFHGLLRLGAGDTAASLSQVVGRLKGASARLVNVRRGCSGRLWQSAFYDRRLRREEDRLAVVRYI